MALALKSKTGCLNCRRRRVKCDETHPCCLRCQKTGFRCAWPGRVAVTSAFIQSNTVIGNTYATLFLQDENVDFKPEVPSRMAWACPASHISAGFPPFRNTQEHQNLVKLSGFLSMLTLDRRAPPATGPAFEFTVALQELWVRDALLAFAGFINGPRDRHSIWKNVLPYYTSATRAVQENVGGPLDEAQLEKLLIASQFLGMIEINNPQNEIFPLLHFEAVGRILESLHSIQAGKTISSAARRFHRIALESYLYHVAIQSMFYSQIDRLPTLSAIYEPAHELATTNTDTNVIIKLDLNIYVILLKLTRFARVESPDPDQRAETDKLNDQLTRIETKASTDLDAIPPPSGGNDKQGTPHFLQMTLLGTAALAILAAKARDRSLLAKSPELRPLVDRLLRRLDPVSPARQWTGDFVWVLTIAACAVYTPNECQRFTSKVQQLFAGFWGSDLKRMKAVLELVRLRRAALVKSLHESVDVDVAETDTLNILVHGGIEVR